MGGRPPSPRVVAATVGRLDASSAWRRFEVDEPGEGWVRLADRLGDAGGLDAWYRTELAATARGHADLAGALIVYRLAGALAELVAGPLLDQRRCLELAPAAISLRFGDAARLDALSVSAPVAAVLAGDPDAGSPGSRVVAAPADMPAMAVDGLMAVFGPLAHAVRARAPFGLRGMWGTLADHLAEVAVRRAREQGRDVEAAWSAVSALIADLAAREPLLRARPRRQAVRWPGGTDLLVAKGTCCLIYKAAAGPGPGVPADGAGRGPGVPADGATGGSRAAAGRHAPAGSPGGALGTVALRRAIDEAACTSCPLRPEDDRATRYAAYLAQLRGAQRE